MELTVRSVIDNNDGNEPEISITTVTADVKERADTLYLRYKEESEGGSVRTFITAGTEGIRLSRSGSIEWDVSFIPNEVSRTVYRIPPYAFDATVRTETARWTRLGSGHIIEFKYSMNIGGAEKAVKMKMTLK